MLTPLFGRSILQKEAHRAQITGQCFLEQRVLHSCNGNFLAGCNRLRNFFVFGTPAPERAHRHVNGRADLGLRQSLHGKPLQAQQPGGSVPFAYFRLAGQQITSEIKTARTGLLWAMREEVARVRAVLAKMHRERKGVGKTPPAG